MQGGGGRKTTKRDGPSHVPSSNWNDLKGSNEFAHLSAQDCLTEALKFVQVRPVPFCSNEHLCRVGQNLTYIRTYGVYMVFLAGDDHPYGHIRCSYTVLANPTLVSYRYWRCMRVMAVSQENDTLLPTRNRQAEALKSVLCVTLCGQGFADPKLFQKVMRDESRMKHHVSCKYDPCSQAGSTKMQNRGPKDSPESFESLWSLLSSILAARPHPMLASMAHMGHMGRCAIYCNGVFSTRYIYFGSWRNDANRHGPHGAYKVLRTRHLLML
jgi:hypothetical protein